MQGSVLGHSQDELGVVIARWAVV